MSRKRIADGKNSFCSLRDFILEDLQGAISDYTKAVEIDPQSAIALVNRGISRELVNDHEVACREWRKAADLSDEDAFVYVKFKC